MKDKPKISILPRKKKDELIKQDENNALKFLQYIAALINNDPDKTNIYELTNYYK
jgi:hypothetical protein